MPSKIPNRLRRNLDAMDRLFVLLAKNQCNIAFFPAEGKGIPKGERSPKVSDWSGSPPKHGGAGSQAAALERACGTDGNPGRPAGSAEGGRLP
jgi:hypothetical protein